MKNKFAVISSLITLRVLISAPVRGAAFGFENAIRIAFGTTHKRNNHKLSAGSRSK